MAKEKRGLDLLYRIVWIIGRYILLPFFFRLKIFGMKNIPKEGGLLIASSHQSYLDPPLLSAASSRPVHFMARKTLFKNWLFGWLIRALHAHPVERGESDTQGIRKIIEILRDGNVTIMFPEGTRTKDGSLGQLKPGVVMLAQRANVPILPAVVFGAYEAWPRNKKFFRLFRRISVCFGRPIYISDYENNGDKKDLYQRVTADLFAQMKEMYGQRLAEKKKK